jgi:hypothetical protein
MLRRRIRPARVATSILSLADDWQPTVMRMLENYSITWGGIGNILIPIDETGHMNEAFWPLVEIFDADLWAAYMVTRRGLELANPDAFREWLNREARKWARKHGGGIANARRMLTADHIMRHSVGRWSPPDTTKDEIRRRTGPAIEHGSFSFSTYRADGPPGHHLVDVGDLKPLPDRVRVLDTHRLPTSLQLLIAMRCGGLAPSHTQRLVDAGVAVEVVLIENSDLDFLLRLAWFGLPSGALWSLRRAFGSTSRPKAPFEEDTFLSTTPLSLSAVGCARLWRWAPQQDTLPVVIVVGSHADDFCYALALDRCGIPAVWLPEEFMVGEENLSEVVRDALVSGLFSGPRGWEERPKVLLSLSISTQALAEVARRLQTSSWGSDLQLQVVEDIDVPPFRLPMLADPACYDDPLEEPFTGDAMARAVPAALPSAVRSTDPWKLSWWAEVNDPHQPLPSRSTLNDLVVADSQGWRAIGRCGRDGISFFSHTMGFVAGGSTLEQMAERPRLRFPAVDVIFDHLFTQAGFTAQESPAGRFRRLTTQLWGDLASLARDLTQPERFGLLRGWLSTERSGDEPGVFTSSRRRYLSLANAVQVSGLDDAGARIVLDGYLTRGGFILKCGHCLHFDWYDLDVVGQAFVCRRCRTETVVTNATWRGGSEPTLYYDLAEVVLQALRGNVEVPTRALARLQKESKSFAETPEVELVDGNGVRFEIDLLAIADGRIVIGEAKTGNAIQPTAQAERAWLAHVARLAMAIAADEVVFATASPTWRPATAARILQAFKNVAPTTVRFMESC